MHNKGKRSTGMCRLRKPWLNGWLFFAAVVFAEEASPSLEMLEYLAALEEDESGWFGPEELAVMAALEDHGDRLTASHIQDSVPGAPITGTDDSVKEAP